MAASDAGVESLLRMPLHEHWLLQSSALVQTDGDDSRVTSAGYQPLNWHSATVPTTVVAALVDDKTWPDPYFGMNLRSLPGMDYPIHDPFWLYPIADTSPFKAPWWYRTEFRLPPGAAGRHIWLRFDGINYRADIWLNGHKVADSTRVVGAFRNFEFDVTDAVKLGGSNENNVLAVKITAPALYELSWNWVDWSPFPPDKNLGLWGDVTLSSSGSVQLRAPHVVSEDRDGDRLVTVSVDVKNAESHQVTALVTCIIEERIVSQSIALAANEARTIHFSPDQFEVLRIKSPRLWWPAGMGAQELYQLTVLATVDGHLSDETSLRFGLRDVTSRLNAEGARQFTINGKDFLVRGAGWAPDLLLRRPAARMEDEMRYVRDLGLNTIRLEGKFGLDPMYDLADEYGILVMAGVCCCDWWERYNTWGDETHTVAFESIKDQVRRLRAHPSALAWLNGSDNMPPPDIEQAYLDGIRGLAWPNPVLPSAAGHVSTLTGPSGVKMTGPYEYIPPNYWYVDKALGGAFGFNSETSMGAAPPPVESLKKFLPPDHLWPIDEYWTYHAGNGTFGDLFGLVGAMDARHGAAKDLSDFERKAQLLAYEGERAMFEAFARSTPVSTGVIQWMLNTPWPGVVWHLYDYYLKPGGGYFGTKKACEPLHIQYSYDDSSVVVVNSSTESRRKLVAHAETRNLDASVRFTRDITVDAAAGTHQIALTIPAALGLGLSSTYFLRLVLSEESGLVLSQNVYWLSTSPDVLKADSTVATWADLTALQSLPAVTLAASAILIPLGPLGNSASGRPEDLEELVRVTLENRSPDMAFFVRVSVTRGPGGDEALPVRWDDNYVTLVPGQRIDLTARLRAADLNATDPAVTLEGWNVAAETVSLAR